MSHGLAPGPGTVCREQSAMHETIDLISHQALRELRAFTRRTAQPTSLELMDVAPMQHVNDIEIDEEHVTIRYNQTKTHKYNIDEITHKEWVYKYNDDPEFVRAVGAVIELARKHLRDLPENLACPPGCAECCSGYEPFANVGDVQRIADHFGIPYAEALAEYIVERPSADGFVAGFVRKVDEDLGSQCIFLKGDRSGRHYCGIYEARPDDCRAFTPIGCDDVDAGLRHDRSFAPGAPFRPRHPATNGKRKRR
jgi:Fe-S-cluster containining protein